MKLSDSKMKKDTHGKLKLTIELVPASSWQNNLRSLLKPKMWDEIRKSVYKNANYKCEICSSKGILHCHEIWEYDDKNHIQRLKCFTALCKNCHFVKHIGFAGVEASKGILDWEKLVKHFMRVNKCSRADFEKHKNRSFEVWEKRSRYEWTLELDIAVSKQNDGFSNRHFINK